MALLIHRRNGAVGSLVLVVQEDGLAVFSCEGIGE
jgi:hypothetical protein